MGVAEEMVEAGGQEKYWTGKVEIVSKTYFYVCVVKCGSQIIVVTIPYFGQ